MELDEKKVTWPFDYGRIDGWKFETGFAARYLVEGIVDARNWKAGNGPDFEGTDPSRPLVLLKEIAEARAELAKLEAETVAKARSKGASWSQIGKELGVSKQAVARKYGE